MLQIALAAPAAVDVVYWDDPANELHIRSSGTETNPDVSLLRTHYGTTLYWEVRSATRDGDLSAPVSGEIATPALPSDLAAIPMTATGTPTHPLTLLEINGPFTGFVVVDASGQVVWYRRTQGAAQGSTMRANGNFVLNDAGNALIEVTPGGEVVHSLDMKEHGISAHHDVIATAQNTLLFISTQQGFGRGTDLVGDAIWEWDPETGHLVRRWSVFDWYDPAMDWGTRSIAGDWVHANSLAPGPHGNVILSLNWLDQVISISPDWQRIEWKLGGARSTFLMDADALFMGQHTAQLLSPTRALMLDNGRDRPDGSRYSRALEVELDTVAMTAHKAWEFRATPDIFAPYVGSARRMSNGNTLVQFGFEAGVQGSTGPIRTFEVRPDGGVVWTLTIGNVSTVYRATPLVAIGDESAVP
jgi:hypothetical protein